MWWKRYDAVRPGVALASAIAALPVLAQGSATPAASTNAIAAPFPPPAMSPHTRRIHVLDADNHTIWINRPGMITVVVGTNEDSQDAARQAGKAMYPFQGRPDFGLIVAVDLRNSMASWVPSVVINRMQASLDQEAVELRPYFIKNGNKANPRTWSHVVPDFKGTVFPQLGWPNSSDDLRVLIFGVDGRELERIDKVDDMAKFQADVKAAIQAQVNIEQARLTTAAKTPGSKLLQTVMQHPPLISFTPMDPNKS